MLIPSSSYGIETTYTGRRRPMIKKRYQTRPAFGTRQAVAEETETYLRRRAPRIANHSDAADIISNPLMRPSIAPTRPHNRARIIASNSWQARGAYRPCVAIRRCQADRRHAPHDARLRSGEACPLRERG
jgi:hypothetical protein